LLEIQGLPLDPKRQRNYGKTQTSQKIRRRVDTTTLAGSHGHQTDPPDLQKFDTGIANKAGHLIGRRKGFGRINALSASDLHLLNSETMTDHLNTFLKRENTVLFVRRKTNRTLRQFRRGKTGSHQVNPLTQCGPMNHSLRRDHASHCTSSTQKDET